MFDREVIEPLLEGAQITLRLTLFAGLLGTVMSVLSGLGSMSSNRPIRYVSRVYVEFFRGTSAIVQLFWLFFGVPTLAREMPDWFPGEWLQFSPMEAGIIVLGLNMGSYGSEVVRGAIQAVGAGQSEASIAIGLTPFQRMRDVIFPQAILGMLPPYGNLLIELLKGTALVSLITLPDILERADRLRTLHTASTLQIYTAVLMMYFAIALGITALVRLAERYYARGLDIGRT